jgi:transcriptional regulator GlxA family with amidase domain
MDSRLKCALDYIASNLSKHIFLSALADVACVSKPQLVRLFQSQIGVSPMRFVEKRRLERAVQLLEHTIMTIEEIAYDIGFMNAFYFSNRFKKHMLVSPRQYRKQMKRA